MPNIIDQMVAYFAPHAAVKRARSRGILAYYEAAKPSRLHKSRRETSSGNDAILRAGTSLRQQARHLDQNYDLAVGVLNTLTTNTIGPNGIGIEPQPRRKDGTIHDAFAKELLTLWKNFCKRPEVTWMHDWPSAQRIIGRSWFRDGEAFAQIVEGLNPTLDHGTTVPLSLELMEADYVPLEFHSEAPAIQQGIEVNAWGRPIAYHVHKSSPIESTARLSAAQGYKRIPAGRMLHLATRHRIRQLRGVSIFASVLDRFDDLKDYEESERIAAKVAASMAAYIIKGAPDDYAPGTDAEGNAINAMRDMRFRPGMIFDDLRPGESVGTIDTNRPNPNLETYRSGQLKAISAAVGASYSAIAHTYTGTYSAQRQELVESYLSYQVLSNEFISNVSLPVWERFVALAVLAGKIRIPTDVVPESVDDALYIPPQMPWIDPQKEAEANAIMEDRAYASGPEIIRRRGGNPMDVLETQARWLREKESAGVPPAPGKMADAANSEKQNEARTDADKKNAAALAASIAAMGSTMSTAVTALATRAPDERPIEVRAGDVHVAAPEIHNHLPAAAAPDVHAHFEATLTPAAAPDVHVTVDAHLPAQPAPTIVVEASPIVNVAPADVTISLPARKTVTTITRDRATSEMTGSTATETDL